MLKTFLALPQDSQEIVVNAIELLTDLFEMSGIDIPTDERSWPLAEELSRIVIFYRRG